MRDLVSLIRQVVRAEVSAKMPSAFGIVESVHLPNAAGTRQYACDIRLQGTQAIYENVPLCTAYLGHVAPPVVGDTVLLSFVGGDPDQPVVAGLVFSDAVAAPEVAEGQMLTRLPHDGADDDRIDTMQTAGTSGAREWSVTLPSGPRLTMTDSSLRAELGDLTLQLDSEAGEARLTSEGGSLSLNAQGDITLKGDGALMIEASGDLTLKAAGNATLQAGGNGTVKAGGTMDVQAALINLN